MIEPIPHIRAISIRKKLNTVGSEPLLLIGDDYNPYYVKNSKLLTPAWDLINEVICHFLLKAWNINTPDIALIEIEKETLNQNYGSRHKKSYYSRVAFGSKQVDGAYDLNELTLFKSKVDFKKYDKPEMFARIGLFDMWVENEDRPPNLKNVMLFEKESRQHFLAIDNAMAFRTGAYESLSDNKFYPTENNYCLQSTFFQKYKRFLRFKDRNWAKTEEENFYFCIAKSKSYLSECCKLMPLDWGLKETIQTILTNFLFNEGRNRSIFYEYLRMWSS